MLSPLTVSAVVRSYLRHAEVVGLFCPEALAERHATLGQFAAHCGELAIADARPFHLTDWIEGRASWRSSSTRKAKANQVNACFNWAARSGRIAANPFAGVNYPEAPPRPPLEDGALAQVAALANKPFERAVRFLRLTGCRLSDLCRATWEMLDWQRGVIVLEQHKSRKKTGKAKLIVLTAEAVDVLIAVKASGAGSGIIFRNTQGRPWTRRTLGQQLRRMKDRHGLDLAATLHGLRHQFGTEGVRNGGSLKMVSLALGHASSAVTEKYYLHLSQDIAGIRIAADAAGRNADR